MRFLLLGILLPGALSPIAVFLGKKKPKLAAAFASIITLISLTILSFGYLTFLRTAHIYVETYGRWLPALYSPQSLGLTLIIDGISYPLMLAAILLFVLSSLYALEYLEEKGEYGQYYFFSLLLLTGILGVFASGDLISFYLFWEVMLIPGYFLIAKWGYKEPSKVALKFFLYTHAGSLLIIVGIGMIFYNTKGILDIITLARYAEEEWFAIKPTVFALFTIGFLVKMGIFPFHSWLPDAHGEAPAPFSALLSGIMIATGGYAFYRFALSTVLSLSTVTLLNYANLLLPVVGLGLFSIYFGGLVAIRETDIKRIPAFSSISHMGYALTGLSMGYLILSMADFRGIETIYVLSLVGGLFHLVTHCWSKGLFFLVAGIVMHLTGERNITRLGGLLSKLPVTGLSATIAAFSIAGAPLFATFFSEIMIIIGMPHPEIPYSYMVAFLVAAGTLISAAYSLRFFWHVFWKKKSIEVRSPGKFVKLSMIALAVLTVLIGVLPILLVNFIYNSVILSLQLETPII